MALIENRKGRDDGGYARLFGDPLSLLQNAGGVGKRRNSFLDTAAYCNEFLKVQRLWDRHRRILHAKIGLDNSATGSLV